MIPFCAFFRTSILTIFWMTDMAACFAALRLVATSTNSGKLWLSSFLPIDLTATS